jgi:hypothetical protein
MYRDAGTTTRPRRAKGQAGASRRQRGGGFWMFPLDFQAGCCAQQSVLGKMRFSKDGICGQNVLNINVWGIFCSSPVKSVVLM